MSEKPALKMAVAYDCFSAGAMAVARMQPLCDRLRSEFEIHTALWGFDEVQHLTRQEARATAEVVEADIVIFAAMDSTAFPARIRNWIESWAPQKRTTLLSWWRWSARQRVRLAATSGKSPKSAAWTFSASRWSWSRRFLKRNLHCRGIPRWTKVISCLGQASPRNDSSLISCGTGELTTSPG